MAPKPTIDHPIYVGIPKDIALYIETEALKFNSMRGVARKSAVGLYTQLMNEYRDFANYLIGMYGQVNLAQEKQITELKTKLIEWEKNWDKEMGAPDNSAAVIARLKRENKIIAEELALNKEMVRAKNKRIEKLEDRVKDLTPGVAKGPINLVDPDAVPIVMVRRMAIKVVERADGTSTVSHESNDMPMMIAIGILDTLRVKFVTVAAQMFTEIKDPA